MSRAHFAAVRRPQRLAALACAGLAIAAALALPAPARAEGKLRIAGQFGIVYLLLDVAREQHLIERQGKAQGIDITVETVQLSGGAAINEALLSGSIDIGGAGVGPMLTLWDRTLGRQDVRGVASLGNVPYALVTTNPNVKTIADFGPADRIATPAVGVSVQSRLLQMASAQRWGDAGYDRLDKLQVALPHPEATAALIKGGTEVDAHFGNPPYQQQILAGNPKAHTVLTSYEVLGGPASASVLYATAKFRHDNPKTYKAFIDALAEAAAFIHAHPEETADLFLRSTHANVDRATMIAILRDPAIDYKLTPQRTLPMATFMHRVGVLKHKPAAARDYFFDDAHNAAAS